MACLPHGRQEVRCIHDQSKALGGQRCGAPRRARNRLGRSKGFVARQAIGLLPAAPLRPYRAVAVRTTRPVLSAPLKALPQTARGIELRLKITGAAQLAPAWCLTG